MQEFDVPILDAMLPIEDAFLMMHDTGRSGVAISLGAEIRLLRFDALVDATRQGTTILCDVTRYEPVAMLQVDTDIDTNYRTLQAAGMDFGLIEAGSSDARVLSRSEGLAGVYLTAPHVEKCKNPRKPHPYPPHVRRPPGSKTCFCGYPLP
jgi:hypothetical protein